MTNPDPFAGGESKASLSFDAAEVGATYSGVVTDPAELVQGKKFGTDLPAVWENKDGTTSPKMSVVIGLKVDGEDRALWAVKPSAMFAALKDAQIKNGKPFEVGGTLTVRYTGSEPSSQKGMHPKKLYAVKYEAPAPKDAFADAGSDSPPW